MSAITQSAMRDGVVDRIQVATESLTPPRRVAGAPSYVMNVSRPETPWRWRDMFLAPLELLTLAWATPLLIFAITLPIGLAAAAAVWIGRMIFRP